jgi:drug/metabolite transporter (DMT)-like permease
VLISLGYLGVVVMIQLFSVAINSDMFIPILVNICASGAIIAAKKLSSNELTTTVLFYSTGAAFIFSAIAALVVGELPSLKDLLLLIAIEIFGLLSNVFYLLALKHGKASLVAPFEYTCLIFAMAISYMFFHEIPNTKIMLGAFLIALSTFWLNKDEIILSS